MVPIPAHQLRRDRSPRPNQRLKDELDQQIDERLFPAERDAPPETAGYRVSVLPAVRGRTADRSA